jgi:hypothetical protein
MSTIQQATREAERRFPVRIRIGICLKVAFLDQTNAWLDANCGVDGCHRGGGKDTNLVQGTSE